MRFDMICAMPKAPLRDALAVALLLAAAGCSARSPQTQQPVTTPQPGTTQQPAATPQPAAAPQPSSGLEYKNQQYGFCFSLPPSWKGYTIVTDQWDGFNNKRNQDEHGPLVSIRHPLWTKENPRLDIPIMVLTRAQWDSIEKENLHIGGAPIPPSGIGENEKYFFALPARFNFEDATGAEEVQQILQGKPLHGSCKS
jgi:hypothetical protein